MISYESPQVFGVSGCHNIENTTTNCQNYNNFTIYISGTNFGLEDSTVLVGSQFCENVIHYSHQNISCTLSGSRGKNQPIFVIQYQGDISEGVNLLSYEECIEGHEFIDNDCVMCSPGYFKNTIGDTFCTFCPDGYYSNISGLHSCHRCIDNSISNSLRSDCLCEIGYYYHNNKCNVCDNTDFFGSELYYCDTTGLHIHNIINKKGCWRSDNESLNFYTCKDENLCPENAMVNNEFICKNYHTGVLCAGCIDGYALDSEGYCARCPEKDDYDKIRGLTAFYIILIIIGFILFIAYVLIKGKKLLNKIVNKLIDKESIEMEELDENSHTSENTDSESSTEEAKETIRDKVNDIFGIKKNETKQSNEVLDAGKGIQQKAKILISYLQILTLISINLNLKWPDFVYDVINALDSINMDVFGITNENIKCSMNINYYNTFIFYLMAIPCSLILVSCGYLCAKYYATKKNMGYNFIKNLKERFIYTLILFVFILYPASTDTILKIFKCDEVEDNWYLTADLSIQCFNSKWYKYAGVAILFTFLYIIGIPYYFHWILKNNKDKLHNKNFSYKYGFIYKGYKDNFWWFETVEMTKKLILMATIIFLEESATRIMIAMIIVFVYVLYISYYRPLIEKQDNILNIMSGTEIFLVLFCGLIYEVKLDVQDSYNEYAFQGFIFLLIVSALIVGNYQIIKAILTVSDCVEDGKLKCRKKIFGCMRKNNSSTSYELNQKDRCDSVQSMNDTDSIDTTASNTSLDKPVIIIHNEDSFKVSLV